MLHVFGAARSSKPSTLSVPDFVASTISIFTENKVNARLFGPIPVSRDTGVDPVRWRSKCITSLTIGSSVVAFTYRQ